MLVGQAGRIPTGLWARSTVIACYDKRLHDPAQVLGLPAEAPV